jgi:hypothetical protein
MQDLGVCLDAATQDLIHPWVADGHLPVVDWIIHSGVWGELKSTYPPALDQLGAR